MGQLSAVAKRQAVITAEDEHAPVQLTAVGILPVGQPCVNMSGQQQR